MSQPEGESKHLRISRLLREAIRSGSHPIGSRLPSEARLVQQHGVSRPTVMRALNDLEAEGLIERRMGSGSFVRSVRTPPPSGRSLGLLVPGLRKTEILKRICGELASVARSLAYELDWGEPESPESREELDLEGARRLCRHFIARRVSGVFFAPFELIPDREEANRILAETLRQEGLPVILLDRDLGPFPKRSDFDLVGIDNMAAGFLLAEHLIKLGCERLAFIARPNSASTVDARIAGARAAIGNRGLEADPRWVHLGDPTDVRFVRRLMAGKRWDALLCANDHTAAELLQTLAREGHRVPSDVRLVGFDDVRYATLLATPLTTIHQPCRDIAVAAMRAMQDRIAESALPVRSHLLTSTLILGESCVTYRTVGRA
jgi:LacI family transcriptional regulator